MEDYLEFAIKISNYAKITMLDYFKKEKEKKYKEDCTIVTKVDRLINEYLIEQVKQNFPNHCVYGEEESYGKSDYAWVCDPVDGTAMYARQVPVAVFSIALVVKGDPVLGVVIDPFCDDIYYAIRGQGAFKNKEKISVNHNKLDGMKSIVHYDIWPNAEYNIIEIIKQLNKETYTVSIGSVIRASLCVATGEFNGIIFPGTTGKNCDIAAIKVIVEEAGGKVTDIFGNEQKYDRDINGAIISNSTIHNHLVEIIKNNIKLETKQ